MNVRPAASIRRPLAAVLLSCLVLLGLPSLALAAPGTNTTPATAVTISSVPFTASDSGGFQVPAATQTANAAVASACNGGTPVAAPRWWRYTPTASTRVVAQTVTHHEFGRDKIDMHTGTAVLSATTGQVLDCSTGLGLSNAGPVSLAASQPVHLVTFLTSALNCDEGCYEWFRTVALRTAPAASPVNDDWAHATPITSLPHTSTTDGTLATSEDADHTLPHSDCSPPGGGIMRADATTWYRFTPAATGPLDIRIDGVRLGQEGSAPVTAAVARLTAAGPEFLYRCDEQAPYPGTFSAGTTYLLMVGDLVPTYGSRVIPTGRRTVSVSGAVALRRHDLVVTGLSWAPTAPTTGAPVHFSATVRNVGSAATPGGVTHGVGFRVDGTPVSWSDTWDRSLAPGESVTLRATGGSLPGAGTGAWNASAGTHTVTATVDDLNRITGETSESNNARTATFTSVAGNQPDLVVTGVSWSPAAPAAGTATRFSATIRNQGAAATPAGVVHGVAFRVDGRTVTWSDTHTASLAPGASVTLTANGGGTGGAWTATAGRHTVTAHVDDVNRIPGESNEADNTRDAALTVGTPASRPDLVVSGIGWTPAAPSAGTAVRMTATITNAGSRHTPGGVPHRVAFRMGTTTVATSTLHTAALPPGGSVTVTANAGGASGAWTAVAGSHVLTAVVDDTGAVPESSETNNSRSSGLVVRAATSTPDLVVSSVGWTPSAVTAGTGVRFRATVRNAGTTPSPAGVVHGVAFRIGGRTVTFSDTWDASLAPGASVTLTADGGGTGGAWTAVSGTHTVTAHVDDVNRMQESVESNNTSTASLTVTG